MFDGTYYYQYDAAGNRTARYENSVDQGLTATPADITIYSYNNDNEMTGVYHFAAYSDYHSAVCAGNLDNGTSVVATMSYDAFGQMVQETTYIVSGDSETGVAENYVYDGGNLVLVLNSDGLVTERELTGLAVDQVFASEFPTLSGGAGGAQGAGTAVDWYLTDLQGSVRDVVTGEVSGGAMTAAAVDHVIYTAYGAPTVDEGTMPRFGFDGLRYDAATGYYFTATRPYDPKTGTWIQPDPIGFLGGQDNLSEFVGNDPTNFVDPSGLGPISPTFNDPTADYPPGNVSGVGMSFPIAGTPGSGDSAGPWWLNGPSAIPAGMTYVYPTEPPYGSGGAWVPYYGCDCCEGGGLDDPNVEDSLVVCPI